MNVCVPDADMGATTVTDPLDPDTDHGHVPDGTEDANHNGIIDPGEGDPNDPADDMRRPIGRRWFDRCFRECKSARIRMMPIATTMACPMVKRSIAGADTDGDGLIECARFR
jgi:hypothetical protein